MRFKTLRTVAVVLLVELVLAIGVVLVVVKTGAYDVAATKPHHKLTEFVLSTTMDNSVRRHASGIEPGARYAGPDRAEGLEHYQAMCVVCHGTPGVDPGEVGLGLNPPAPDLAESVTDLEPREVYWIIKNGIKMTGMPAFGPTHDEAALWNLTAFVKNLPGTTPQQYSQWVAAAGDGDQAHQDH